MSSATPLVSILIPCYNAEPWLAATLRSALAQTWPHTEIVVVDDGSTDGSLPLAHGFAGERVRIVSQSNSGQCAALNRALREARGDFIQYLDADDLLDPEKIARQLAALRDCGPDWIVSGSWARFADDPAEARFEEEAVWRDLDPIEWLTTSWSGGGMMHGAAWLIPRAVAERAGPWAEDLTLVNDFDYFARVLLASGGVKFCREARTYYRSGLAGSLSDQKSPRAWQSAHTAFTRGTTALLAREDSARTRRAAAITFQSFAYAAYPTVPELVTQAERRVRELGGCDYPLQGGRAFALLAALGGWKLARRAQALWRRRTARR